MKYKRFFSNDKFFKICEKSWEIQQKRQAGGYFERNLWSHYCHFIEELLELSDAFQYSRIARLPNAALKVLKDFSFWNDPNNDTFFNCMYEAKIKNTIEDEFADVFLCACLMVGRCLCDFTIDRDELFVIVDKRKPINFLDLTIYERDIKKFISFASTEETSGITAAKLAVSVEALARKYNVNLALHVELKMKYNRTRKN